MVTFAEIAEATANTRRGERGFVLAVATAPRNPGENTLLPDTMTELHRLGIGPREVGDGGFQPSATGEAMPLARTGSLRALEPSSRRTGKRQGPFRTG